MNPIYDKFNYRPEVCPKCGNVFNRAEKTACDCLIQQTQQVISPNRWKGLITYFDGINLDLLQKGWLQSEIYQMFKYFLQARGVYK